MATPNLIGISSVIPTVLYSGQLANGANTVYTVAASKAVQVKKLVLTNVTANPVVVTVSVVPSGGSVDGTHEVVHAYSLAGNDDMVVDELTNVWLGDGDKISVNAGAATAIDALLSGLLCS